MYPFGDFSGTAPTQVIRTPRHLAALMAELGFDFDDTRGLYEKRISNTVNLQASWPMARRGDRGDGGDVPFEDPNRIRSDGALRGFDVPLPPGTGLSLDPRRAHRRAHR